MNLHQSTFPSTPSSPHLPALLLQPQNPIALLVFGHGAGTPMRAPLMHHMAEALAHQGIATFRYDYPYSHRLQDGYTEDLIDPLEVLLATTRAAIQHARQIAPYLPLFLAGRSMSAQVMSLLLAREPLPHVRGLICYVYPNRWRVLLPDTVAHLPNVPVPMLFIQGTRDPEYCDLNKLQTVLDQRRPPPVIPASSAGTQHHARSQRTPPSRSPGPAGAPTPPLPAHLHTLHVIPDADHAFQLPPDSSRTHHDAIRESATTTATWIHHQLKAPENAPPHPS
ncbi:MAG: alpha/beta hydrolase [Chloroflexota bacterium]|nr:alpha/beta hydrolase [Chloroflexota bacterium]